MVLDGLLDQGGMMVNWADTLGYTKPRFRPVALPNEAGAAHKWYVDLSSGSGSACTIGAPCSWASLVGKAGVADGTGAYIYIKGTGGLSDIALVGSVGAEVVVKPWDDSTTATITGRNNWAAAHQNVVFDGGPNMQIRFSSTGGNQFDPSIYLSESAASNAMLNLTFRRARWSVPNAGIQFAAYADFTNLSFINCEHDGISTVTSDQHHIYISLFGTGDGRTGNGLNILSCIFRDTPGEAIELRMAAPGANLNNLVLDGNAIHNVGNGTTAAGWHARSWVTISTEGGGSFGANGQITYNLIWNTGENAGRTWDNPSSWLIANNSCWNWGMSPDPTGSYSAKCFMNFANTDAPGTFKNNAMFAQGNDHNGNSKTPFPAGFSNTGKSFNACETGKTCGTSAQANLTTSSFLSLDENNPSFLKLSVGSTLLGNGTSVGLTTDYLGNPVLATPSIGAFAVENVGGAGSLQESEWLTTLETQTNPSFISLYG